VERHWRLDAPFRSVIGATGASAVPLAVPIELVHGGGHLTLMRSEAHLRRATPAGLSRRTGTSVALEPRRQLLRSVMDACVRTRCWAPAERTHHRAGAANPALEAANPSGTPGRALEATDRALESTDRALEATGRALEATDRKSRMSFSAVSGAATMSLPRHSDVRLLSGDCLVETSGEQKGATPEGGAGATGLAHALRVPGP
jgi:hypothetical protein